MTPRLRGALAPVLTPFTRRLEPDVERFIAHCRWLVDNHAGLAIFGTNSEAASLSVEERLALTDALLEAGIPAAKLLPGTGACSIKDAVRLTRHAVENDAAGVLMIPPFYYKGVSDEGLFRNFAEVIERVGDKRLRIYLYNIPPVSQVPITVALIERLLGAYPDNVAGIKDSSGDWNNTKAYLDNFAGHGFDVFPGSESFLLRGMRNGGAGCISATANVNPGRIAQLFATWSNADADTQQAGLDEIRGIFARYPMIPALKTAIAHYSGDESWVTVRPPLVELTAEQKDSLIDELDRAGFIMPGLAA